jgi:hypothetical protein
VSDVAHPAGQRAAADYLRQLLLKPGRYQDAWRERVARPRDGVINQQAVAEVIAIHLAGGGRSGTETEPYRLRETVSEALSGRRLNRQTLQLFIDAFGLSEDEAGRAWRLWQGATTIRVLAGASAYPEQTEQDLWQALGRPKCHQTLTLHDHVRVDADGRIDRANVIQVIEATADGLDRIPFLADTNVLTIEVGHGCKDLAEEIRQVADGVFATEIILARTLELGETTSLSYDITFRFPGKLDEPDFFRRASLRQTMHYDMRVQFDPDRLPARVWWTTWDTRGDIQSQQEAAMDSQHACHRYLQLLDKTVAGFYWTWHSM